MRLRRLRGLSQNSLAKRMGTQQPAIARIEAGDGNLRLTTLVALAKALDATVRIDIEPTEHLEQQQRAARWWETTKALDVSHVTNFFVHATINLTFQPPPAAQLGVARILSEEHVPIADFDIERAAEACLLAKG